METKEKKKNPAKWLPKDFWIHYIGPMSPSAFLKISGVYSPYRAVEKHLRRLSTFYGIVRQGTWKETFANSNQFTFEEVFWGIIAYLKETEHEWKQEWKEFWLAQDVDNPLEDTSIIKKDDSSIIKKDDSSFIKKDESTIYKKSDMN
ncbi:MAG TPA: hypothetical protein PLT82_05260 [Candidatus Hydrogenedens sp.]|nr:hypothetical protein [Candidatus Hydrogenedens sp.]HOK08833.1 hypothetical protein [Candidatus Hydrogenedens sp.]HOL18681.1 hypothetical protein [Candidatus Hydrogenedens sp.]HPP58522.1 hypothetical protein [Candidatus Hydrogenedens sp.]